MISFKKHNGETMIFEKFNPHHGKDGRFSTANGSVSFVYGFGNSTTKEFSGAVASAKEAVAKESPETAWRVTAHLQQELEEYYPGAKMHVTKGGSTVAVTKDGDIISVCKKPGDSTRGKDLIDFAVENGGKKLDSYSGNHGFYIKCGFEPVSWCKWDDRYTPDDWIEGKHEREPIIFYKHTGKKSTYVTPEDFTESVKASKDYDAAQKFRDENM